MTPPPTLPGDVGVRWVSDTGGIVDPGGAYLPAYERSTVRAGVVTGPSPAGSQPDAFNAFLGYSFAHDVPDGTAKYPFNGFAGEGISGSNSTGIVTMTFEAGTCTISMLDTDYFAIFPSPSGASAAVVVANTDADASRVSVVSLVDGAECPTVATDTYSAVGGDGDVARGPVVWSPDSTHVVYSVLHSGDPTHQRLVRRSATVPSSPTVVIPAAEVQLLVPLGWSSADRLLVETSQGDGLVLATLPASGGRLRVLDKVDAADFTGSPATAMLWFVGYFAPGSTTVVFTDVARATNSAGETFPWLRVRRISDAAGAVSAPLATQKPTLTWHSEAVDPVSGPPFQLVDVPNSEVLERFTR